MRLIRWLLVIIDVKKIVLYNFKGEHQWAVLNPVIGLEKKAQMNTQCSQKVSKAFMFMIF